MSTSEEPTTFALDVYFASGQDGDTQLAQHIAGCPRCAAYLAELDRKGPPLPPPAGARPARHRPWLAAGALLSACAAVALWLNTGDSYIGSKGMPAVQALIRSGGQARVWDGKAPIRAGDAIGLRTDCDRFSHVTVAVADGGERTRWSRVFDGSCKGHEALPFTLIADDRPGSEQVEIVFSRLTPSDAALQRAISGRERSDTTWVITLVLPKTEATP